VQKLSIFKGKQAPVPRGADRRVPASLRHDCGSAHHRDDGHDHERVGLGRLALRENKAMLGFALSLGARSLPRTAAETIRLCWEL